MAIGDIFRECEIIELVNTSEEYQQSDSNSKGYIDIKDNVYLDFYYLLKGDCSLVFEVTKIYDPYQKDDPDCKVTEEGQQRQREIELLKNIGKKLNTMLIEPYFKTEVQIPSMQERKQTAQDVQIEKLAIQYCENPESEENKFLVESPLLPSQTVSEQSLKLLRPNYVEYNQKLLEAIKNKISLYPNAKFPKKVTFFQDKLV